MSRFLTRCWIICFAWLLTGLVSNPELPAQELLEQVSAPVIYEDLMLIISDADGVAAVVFTDRFDENLKAGVNFRYRYESNDGETKLEGMDTVYETRNENGGYTGGKLFITAGPIKFEWSYGGKDRGWVYYKPEVLRVHMANSQNFEESTHPHGPDSFVHPKLDLKRFRQK